MTLRTVNLHQEPEQAGSFSADVCGLLECSTNRAARDFF